MSNFLGLITDRTLADVNSINKDSIIPSKGAYNITDLNRVEDIVRTLNQTFIDCNLMSETLVTKTDWQFTDIFTQNDSTRYLNNVKKLREALAVLPTTPTVPSSMNNLTYTNANNIEKILTDIESLAYGMENYFVYSGVSNSGQPRLFQNRFRHFIPHYYFSQIWLDLTQEYWTDFISTATWLDYNARGTRANGTYIYLSNSTHLPLVDFGLGGNAIQSTTPTPDSPVPVQVVAGDNTVKVVGKNLLTPTISTNTVTTRGMTLTYKNTGEYVLTDTATSTGNIVAGNLQKYYTIKSGDYLHLCNDKIPSGTIQIVGGKVGGGQSFAVTINSVNKIIDLSNYAGDKIQYFFFYLVSGASVTNMKMTPMIIHNVSTATTYEAYKEQTQLLQLGSIELAKIGNYQDRIYKSNNKWYAEKNIGKVTLNGSENIVNPSNTSYSSTILRFNVTVSDKKYATSSSVIDNIFCNKFQTLKLDFDARTQESIAGHPAEHIVCVFIDKTRLESANVAGFKTWLSNNNTIVYYILATPTTTEITDTTLIGQLENALKLHTYDNITNITTNVTSGNSQPYIDIEYAEEV